LRAGSEFWNGKRRGRPGWLYSIGLRMTKTIAALVEGSRRTPGRRSPTTPTAARRRSPRRPSTAAGRSSVAFAPSPLSKSCFPTGTSSRFVTNRDEAIGLVEAEHRAHAVSRVSPSDDSSNSPAQTLRATNHAKAVAVHTRPLPS